MAWVAIDKCIQINPRRHPGQAALGSEITA
jgi:hypothetical protein